MHESVSLERCRNGGLRSEIDLETAIQKLGELSESSL
jgi:hypothetical protein